MGMPENPCVSFVFNKSSTVLSGARQTGSLINPCSYFFTRLIWAAFIRLFLNILIMINEAKQSSMTGNSRSLFFCCIIRVYNSNSTHQRHCNGHFPLGDGVHRGGDQRRLQVDLRRQGRGQIDVVCVEIDKTRMQQEIIISETISRFEKLRFRLESYFSNDFTKIFFWNVRQRIYPTLPQLQSYHHAHQFQQHCHRWPLRNSLRNEFYKFYYK